MDKALNFNTTLKNINNYLNRLDKIGLNTTEFKKVRDEIIRENKEEVAKSYDYANAKTFGQTAFLEQSYITSNTKLEKLYQTLIEYDIYISTASFTKVLKDFITKTGVKSKEEFEEIRTSIILVLDKLLNSHTLDYKIERPVFEDLYHMTYLFIKEEIKYLKESPTLDILKTNDIHKSNLTDIIIKEIETLNLNDPKYRPVKEIYNKISSEPILTQDYCNLELLKALEKTTYTEAEFQKEYENLSLKLQEYYIKLQDLEKNSKNTITNISSKKASLKKIYQHLFKKLGLVTVSLSTVIALFFYCNHISKKNTQKELYKNTITTFNPETSTVETISEYNPNKNDSIILHEYSPYERNENLTTRVNFTRTDKSYDLSTLDQLDYNEYLNLDLEALGIDPVIKDEFKEELNINDLYAASYKIIEKITVNPEDNKLEFDEEAYKVFSILGYGIIILIHIIYESVRIEQNNRNASVLLSLSDIINDIIYIKDHKKEIEDYETKQQEIITKIHNLITENNYLISNLEEIMPYLKENSSLKETKDTIELIRKLKTNEAF